MKSVLLTLTIACAGSLLAPSTARAALVPQAQPTPGQAAPTPAPAPPAPAQDGKPLPPSEPTKSVFTPAPPKPPLQPPPPITQPIPDIDKARVEPLSYVRHITDVVKTHFGRLDVNADPVLHVGDRAVTRNEFRRRALMYMSGAEIDREVTRALTDQEIRRQTAAGVDPKVFAPDAAAIDQKLEDQKEMISMQIKQQAQNQTNAPAAAAKAVQDFLDSINNSTGGMEAYRALLAADVQFEKVFLPFPAGKVEGVKHDPATGPPPVDEPKPDWMPQVSWDALSHDDAGRNLRSFVKGWAIDGEGIPSLFKPSILDKLRSGLIGDVGVDFFFDADLPDDAFVRVGGEMVKVDDMWARANVQLADADIDLIVRELLMLDKMKASLKEAGRWMDRDAFAAAWKKHDAEYAQTIFPLRTMIIFKGYTSVDRYREHYQYRLAFNNWKKETVSEDEVKKHYEDGGRLFFERGDAVVDIGFKAIGDQPFGDATLDAAAQDLQRGIDDARTAGGADAKPADWFATVKAKYVAASSGQSPDNLGFQRSQLRMQLAEDELSIFLNGYSLADDVVYHGHPGEVFGPWTQRCRRHAWGAEPNAGAWAVLVNTYRSRQPMTPFEGRQKDLAWEDFLDLNYFHWSQDCLQTAIADVKLPPSAAGAEEPSGTAAPPHRTWMYIVGVGAVLVMAAAVRGK